MLAVQQIDHNARHLWHYNVPLQIPNHPSVIPRNSNPACVCVCAHMHTYQAVCVSSTHSLSWQRVFPSLHTLCGRCGLLQPHVDFVGPQTLLTHTAVTKPFRSPSCTPKVSPYVQLIGVRGGFSGWTGQFQWGVLQDVFVQWEKQVRVVTHELNLTFLACLWASLNFSIS